MLALANLNSSARVPTYPPAPNAVEVHGDVGNVATIRGAVLDNMVFDAAGRLFVSDSDVGAVYRIAKGRGVRT